MSRTRLSTLLLASASAALFALPAGASARTQPRAARVPQGFVGTALGAPVFPTTPPGSDLASQLDLMVASGVESIRVPFDWATIQPYASWSDVPPDQQDQFEDLNGMPTNIAPIDQLVGLAAFRGLTVLPTILDAPAWDGLRSRDSTVSIPKSNRPYAAFVKALVERYGPHGTFWQSQPRVVPIRMWQIWNEPNLKAFWFLQPFQRRYVRLLRAAHDAIRSVDPRAKIVLAGLPNFSWVNLAQIYQVRGAHNLFDVVAVHPYTRDPKGVITILRRIRRVMNAAHDGRKTIVADEISWPSALGKTVHTLGLDFETTEAGQARKLRQIIPLLAANRARLHLQSFYYYTWATVEHRNGLPFDFSGLLKVSAGQFIEKPAFSVFRRVSLALEHCRKKGSVATVCVTPG
jgi:hypothetical protein